MNDTILLMTGISVFGLMIIAIILTMAEFRQIRKQESREKKQPAGKSGNRS